MQTFTVFRFLRHYEGVLSRLSEHAVDVKWRRGEAILVPVSAFIKTQPEGENNGASQTELPQIELKLSPARGAVWLLGFWRRSTVSEEMWHILGEPYQMCLIGRGVCRMATRDPPWLRKNTLYSSWKTCRHGPDPSVTKGITCMRLSGSILCKIHFISLSVTWERCLR